MGPKDAVAGNMAKISANDEAAALEFSKGLKTLDICPFWPLFAVAFSVFFKPGNYFLKKNG